jgi:hypothetical protein
VWDRDWLRDKGPETDSAHANSIHPGWSPEASRAAHAAHAFAYDTVVIVDYRDKRSTERKAVCSLNPKPKLSVRSLR